jgi:glycosyltransferase involved in cell wall biosynthesis
MGSGAIAQGLRLSVLMTTYNPHRGRLERTLNGLLSQTLPASQWEFILVDNSSSPSLSSTELRLERFTNWHLVQEKRLGTAFGRATAVLRCGAPFIVSVDDDNVLDPSYFERAIAILDRSPRLGVGGGKSLPEWEQGAPEPWVNDFLGPLAIRDFGDHEFVTTKSESVTFPKYRPIGAGMIARREAIISWATDIDAKGSALGQRGPELLRGEDDDIVLRAFHEAWEIGYYPELTLTHLIPPERVTRQYLGRLIHGIAKSEVLWMTAHGVKRYPPAARWTVPLRKLRAYLRFRAWEGPTRYIWWKGACGQFEGRAIVSSAERNAKAGG